LPTLSKKDLIDDEEDVEVESVDEDDEDEDEALFKKTARLVEPPDFELIEE
jgi:hypothetical protein